MDCRSYDHSIFNMKPLNGGQVNLDIKDRVVITVTAHVVYTLIT